MQNSWRVVLESISELFHLFLSCCRVRESLCLELSGYFHIDKKKSSKAKCFASIVVTSKPRIELTQLMPHLTKKSLKLSSILTSVLETTLGLKIFEKLQCSS